MRLLLSGNFFKKRVAESYEGGVQSIVTAVVLANTQQC